MLISKTFLYFVLIPALLPVFIILWYVYSKDKVEREPIRMVIKVLICGAIFALPCIPCERLANAFLTGPYEEGSLLEAWKKTFYGVALIEEFSKWLVLMIFVWKSPDFNYRYDGIVYAVTASLGFAAIENVGYIISFGTGVSISRALFAIPGHATFSVFMGFYLSRAKAHFDKNQNVRKVICLILSMLISVTVHAIYDFLLSDPCQELGYSKFFIAFVILLDIWAFFTIRHEFKTDRPI